ncbi:hypothetical protein BaRGS_00039393 [Batillaria attramentaria]|uniref:Uncharacterized protein n=1 Tax=Batillaria attramentaria TaxID=370345 RepID=A0ABD0J3V9_9CAEN
MQQGTSDQNDTATPLHGPIEKQGEEAKGEGSGTSGMSAPVMIALIIISVVVTCVVIGLIGLLCVKRRCRLKKGVCTGTENGHVNKQLLPGTTPPQNGVRARGMEEKR